MLADVERALDHLSAGDHAKLRHWLDAMGDRGLVDRNDYAVDVGDDGVVVQLGDDALADHKAGSGRRLPAPGRPWRRLVSARGNG